MAGKKLTHLDDRGKARMVDVGEKPITRRTAVAEARITLQPATFRALVEGTAPKGEVLGTARLAGIMAAKRTAELIPLCHPLALDSIDIQFDSPPDAGDRAEASALRITATASISAKTGVEMEALTAATVAALTVYDMCKAIDKSMSIDGVRLVSKTGGTRRELV